MSTSAQYASNPLSSGGTSTTADTSYSQPTETTVGIDATAWSNGGRIDQLNIYSEDTSVAGLLRFWKRKGVAFAPSAITSITFVGTTATVVFSALHGLSTNARLIVQGAFPADYNVKNVQCTVTNTTTLTYTMASTPTINASTMPQISASPATPVYIPLGNEIVIPANVGSATNPAWQFVIATGQPAPAGGPRLPILLDPGESLCHTVTVTQTNALSVAAQGGNL